MKAERPIAWPTLLSCLAVFAAFVAAAASMTDIFEQWTFEDLRVAESARGTLVAPPTAILTSDGARETLFASDEPAAIYLVDFVYTSCLTVCQSLGSEHFQMQQSLDATGDARVRLVSLSFDRARDTQAELNRYAAMHRADPARWTVAAAASDSDNRALLRRLGIVAVPDGFGGYVHNGSIHLIDGRGVVRGLYDYTQWPTAMAAARRLARTAP